jgi:hypothetical protein
MRSQLLFFFIGILLHTCVEAQFFPTHHYPQNYFQWPTNAKIGIVANFGELRPNHYHMGLDVRTDSKENMNVLAAAEGYVAKVHIDATGFGRALYINHPNGFTTLYAHLNDFNPEIEQYVKEQQYRLKKWNIDLEIPAGILPVKKGGFIAYSGNTGGSQGPHIHFEIRETATDKVLNPLLFGMPIPDRQAPDLIRLAIYHTCFHFSAIIQTSHLHAFDDFFPHHFVIAEVTLMMGRSFDYCWRPLRKAVF